MTANAPTNSGYWTDSGNYATSFAGGSGTSSDPYLISTPQQLAYLSYLVNNSSNNSFSDQYYDYYGKYYEQTANLDMSAYWWDAIGYSEDRCFYGYFDGNNYSISGLFTDSDSNYQGLFGYVEINSSDSQYIKNINLINSEIRGVEYVGGIIGCLYYDNSSNNYDITISNCSVDANIYADEYVGGIVGGSIHDENSDYSGGIIITDCASKGNEISASGSYVAGIIGNVDSHSISITKSYNLSNITANSSSAGIVANLDVITTGRISYCYNLGSITATGSRASGIACELYCTNGTPSVSCCFNMGNIKGSMYVSGILGRLNRSTAYGDRVSTVQNCYNRGNIEGTETIGGIVAYAVWSSDLGVYNCYNTGIVTGTELCGAIVGDAGNNVIKSCFSAGSSLEICADFDNTSTSACYIDENYENCLNRDWYNDGWSYSYSWNFSSIWAMDENINDGLPYLKEVIDIMVSTITYHPNGASGDEVVESKVGNASYIIRSNMFSRSGYNFTGWNTEANGGGTSYSAGSSYSELANLDLYAQWSRITYTIKYDKNASDATGSMANTTKYYGTNVTLRSNAFKRTGYSFAGWATKADGGVVYSNGATYTANANVTLYAKWTAHKYTVKFNGNGSTSGSMSNQTFTYGTAQKLTSNAFKKTGFTFDKWTRNADGTGTSYTNGQSVKNLTSTNGAEIKLYAQWKANNEAKYDSAGDYWYVENGKIPQTKVTNSTLISNLNKATTNGGNYYIAGEPLTAKVYNDTEYCKWNNNWYEVEPIRWRLDASSSQKDGYGTTTDTNAVLAEIVYVDQYSSSSIDAGEGYSNQSVTDFMRNGISTTYLVNYATSTQTFGTGTSLYGTNASTTARMFVSSQSEITAVNGDLTITFSDLVKDIIKSYGGTNSYFTRDLGSNYNNITCINAVGKETQCFATNFRGLQFTIRFTEYGCVD